jgi:hypothetical protein
MDGDRDARKMNPLATPYPAIFAEPNVTNDIDHLILPGSTRVKSDIRVKPTYIRWSSYLDTSLKRLTADYMVFSASNLDALVKAGMTFDDFCVEETRNDGVERPYTAYFDLDYHGDWGFCVMSYHAACTYSLTPSKYSGKLSAVVHPDFFRRNRGPRPQHFHPTIHPHEPRPWPGLLPEQDEHKGSIPTRMGRPSHKRSNHYNRGPE